MRVFFSEDDYRLYLTLLAVRARRHSLDIWTYCLMPNHVHMIAVPSSDRSLARPLAETHQTYAAQVNRQHGWTGHLWQERFSSFPMDETYLRAAIRYVLLNPVRAGLAHDATDWPYSSARAHVLGEADPLVNRGPADERIADWNCYLELDERDCDQGEALRRHGRTGRPLGPRAFVEKLERATGRRLRPRKVGRKPKRK